MQTDKDQKVCENVWDDFFENFDKFRLEGIFEKYQVIKLSDVSFVLYSGEYMQDLQIKKTAELFETHSSTN